MAAWNELKAVLLRLRDEQPGVLMQYPMPEVDEGRVPPFGITLAPSATATAEELHRQFGDDVELTVGARIGKSAWLGRRSSTTTVDLDGRLVAEASGRARDALDKAFG